MKRLLFTAACALAFWVSILPTTSAQDLDAYFPPAGGVYDPNFVDPQFLRDPGAMRAGDPDPIGPMIYSDNRFGEGIGYSDDYFNLRAFLPFQIGGSANDIVFSSIGGSLTGEGDFAANLGGGYRRYVPAWNRIFGVSLWYDMDDAYSDTFTRGGVSFETMGAGLDVRVNGYFMSGDDVNTIAATGGTVLAFQGNQLLFNNPVITENAFDGFDAEVGGLMPLLGRYGFYGYVGGYYLDSDRAGDTTGVSIRTNTLITEGISLGTQYTYDDTFDSNFFVNLVIGFPTRANRVLKPRPMNERMVEPVIRQQRIPVLSRREDALVAAINPADGAPFFIVHVDPNGNGTVGNAGTFENPFRTLEAARTSNNAGVDIIRVVGAANLTTPNGALAVTAPFGLFAGQRLLSTSELHIVTTTTGPVTLPGFNGAPRPLINNSSTTAGSVIALLGGGTEVSGFNIDGQSSTGAPTHSGIVNSTPIVDFNVNRNDFNNVVNAVALTEATGTGLFNSNTLNGDQVVGGGIAQTGFSVANSSGTLDLTATDNTINLFTRGTDITSTGTAQINSTFQSNTYAANTSGGLVLSARDNSIMNIILGGTTDTGNSFISNGDSGAAVRAFDNANIASLTVAGNIFQTNVDNLATIDPTLGQGDGFILARSALSTLNNVNIGTTSAGNTFAGNLGDGLEVLGQGGDNFVNRVNLFGNTYTSNLGAGANLNLNSDAVFVFNSSMNTYIGNVTAGLNITGTGNSALGDIFAFNAGTPLASASVFDGETFTNNAGPHINLNAQGQSWQNFLLSGVSQQTTITGGASNGVTILNNAVATVGGNNPTQSRYTIFETLMTGVGGDGVNATFTGAEDVTITGNPSRAGNNVLTIGALNRPVTISGSGGQGVEVTSAHVDIGLVAGVLTTVPVASLDTINLDSLTSIGNGDDGFELLQQAQSAVNMNVVRSAFRNNGGVGLEIDNQSATLNSVYNIGTTTAGTGNVFQGNTLQGIYVQTLSPVVAGGDAAALPLIGNIALLADPQIASLPLGGGYASQANEALLTFTRARVNIFNNIVVGNGNAGNAADGIAIATGTNTNMIAAISGNTLGGNAGADINLVSILSQEMNTSITNAPPAPDAVVLDTVGFVDLALGLNFAAFPPSGQAPIGALPNNGMQFVVNTRGGSTPLAGRTEVGLFTQADTASGVVIKPANRSTFMVVRVFDANPSVLNQNVFAQSGPVITTLNNANLNIGGIRAGVPAFNTIQFQPLGNVFP